MLIAPSPVELTRRQELLARPIPLPLAPKPDYTHTPVVIVTTSDITLRGQRSIPVGGIADGRGAIQPLLTALEQLTQNAAAEPRQLILQADAALDAVVIERGCCQRARPAIPISSCHEAACTAVNCAFAQHEVIRYNWPNRRRTTPTCTA